MSDCEFKGQNANGSILTVDLAMGAISREQAYMVMFCIARLYECLKLEDAND